MNLAPESSSQLHSDLTVSLKSYRRSMSSSDLCWTSRDSPESAHLNRTQLLPAESSGQDKCRVHPKVTSSQHHLTELDQTGAVLYRGQRLPAVLRGLAKHRHQPPVQVRHLQLELIQVELKALKGRSHSDAGSTSQ